LTAVVERPAAPESAGAAALDPVTVEVIRRRLVAIADEVDVNITRTAFSPYIYEYKDYAVGVVDHRGDLICQCTAGMPVFVADVMRAAVLDGLALYGADELHHGDCVITNYAGTIGQHLNNVTMYTPIHAHGLAKWAPVRRQEHAPTSESSTSSDANASGDLLGHELIGFMVVVMHWIDVGGRDVGSISKFATDIFQEGIQFRTVKLRARGEPVREIYRMIEHNTRFPVEMMGDINSQIGGCLMGRDGVAALVARYGVDTFRAALNAIWDQ
jgi:N-methylhydantoinase B